MDSILTSVKKLLGITEDCMDFDADIIMHINSVFMVLNQIGVGPAAGFAITDKNDYWEDYIEDTTKLQIVKSYMALKVRLLFDPPASSAHMECIKQQISEFEWRLSVAVDPAES